MYSTCSNKVDNTPENSLIGVHLKSKTGRCQVFSHSSLINKNADFRTISSSTSNFLNASKLGTSFLFDKSTSRISMRFRSDTFKLRNSDHDCGFTINPLFNLD